MSTAPPPASQAGAEAPPPSVIEGGTTVFVPPLNPMATSKAIEASASPEVLAWLRAAWGEWDARPQVAVALVYRACQAAGFIPQPDDTFKGFMAWIPSGVADAAQTRVITAAATPARQPASQQATGDFPARLPGGEEVEDVEDVEEAEAVTKALLESAKKNKKRIKRARQRALLIGVIAALTGIAGVIAGATGGWVAFAAAALALITGVAGLITGIKTYGGHSRRPRR